MSTTRGDSTQQPQTTRGMSPAAAATPTSLRRTSARFSRPTSVRTSADSTRSHMTRARPTRRSPTPTRSRSPSPPPPPPRCWAVTWDREQKDCVHEALPTPKALQAYLDDCVNHARSPPPAGIVGIANIAEDVRSSSDALGSSNGQQRRRPRLVLRGMAPAFLRVLLDSPLGIDAGFVEAHAARRRYQQPPSSSSLRCRRRHGRAPATAAQWNHPELVSGFRRALWSRGGGGGGGGGRRAKREDVVLPVGDARGRVAVRAVSDVEDLAAMECRVSVWVAEKVDVLFLDQPVWDDPGSLLRKGKRKRMDVRMIEEEETGGKRRGAFPKAEEEEEEIPSLEDALQEILAEGSDLVDILEEAAYGKWLDFFEVLTPRQSLALADGSSLEWRALQALEGNLDMAKSFSHERRQSPTYIYPDWSSLLQRLRDRAALRATRPPTAPIYIPPDYPRRRGRRTRTFHADNFINLPAPPPRGRSRPPRVRSPHAPAKGGGGGGDENQRALDRVTYLGGILLPISIVSSVLSMNQDFEPGQPLFWVFWAAAVPLTVLTFVVIYADKLRSSEVWEEIGSLGSGGSVLGEQAAEAEAERYGRTEKKKEQMKRHEGKAEYEESGGLPLDDRARRRHRQSAATRPQAMAYAGQDEIVIDLGDVVAQPSRPLSLEPRTSHQQQQQPDEGLGTCPPLAPSFDEPMPIIGGDEEEAAVEAAAEDEEDDENFEYDLMGAVMYVSRPIDGTRPHAWRKKQLGWAGAARCMLGMQKPLRVEDGLPVAPGPRRDVQRRLRQVKRRASAEGRRSLSF